MKTLQFVKYLKHAIFEVGSLLLNSIQCQNWNFSSKGVEIEID